jgi:hypothetical protein
MNSFTLWRCCERYNTICNQNQKGSQEMEIQRGTKTTKVVKTNRNALLKSIFILTILLSFTVLLVGGYWIFKEQAPRPLEVTNEKGEVLFTKDSIMGGQAVFQKYGLMDYGTVLGHGSYMGPDYYEGRRPQRSFGVKSVLRC